MLAGAHTHRKGTHLPTPVAMRRRVLAAGTQRLREPTLLQAAATAAVAHLMQVAGEAHLTAGVVAEVLTAVAEVLTATVKISQISTFQKGPSLSNAAGLLLSYCLQSLANPTRGSATLFVRAG